MEASLMTMKRRMPLDRDVSPKKLKTLEAEHLKSHEVQDEESQEKGHSNSVSECVVEQSCDSLYKGVDLNFTRINLSSLPWKKIKKENLDLDYTKLFPSKIASALFTLLEEELEYFTGDMTKVRVFGRWCDIPRKHGTYGDNGLTYKYSGRVTPARPWPRPVKAIRDLITKVTGQSFNFVLVNRYKDGEDRMGEHKDDEKDLDRSASIASVSLGQPRDFYFKHQDAKRSSKKLISAEKDKVNLVLENGSLLMMNYPTNNYWYHALPVRKSALGVRINLTFRKIIVKS